MGFLEQNHIDKIFSAYKEFADKKSFSALVNVEDVLARNGNMAINLYVRTVEHNGENEADFEDVFLPWENASKNLKTSMNELFKILEN